MTVVVDDKMIITIAKNGAVPVGIVAPVGCGRRIEAVVVAFVDFLGATGAGGFSM